MDNLVTLTLLIAMAVIGSQSQNISSSNEYVNEVNHVQVGVCFQKELKTRLAVDRDKPC